MIHVGLDPGKSGALALWDPQRDYRARWMAPLEVIGQRRTPKGNVADVTAYDPAAMAEIVREIYGYRASCGGEALTLYAERVTTRPEVVAQQDALLTGFGYGLWLGMFYVLGLPVQEVTSNRWKRDMWSLPEAADIQPPPQPSRALNAKERNRLLNQRRAVLKRYACTLAARLCPKHALWFKRVTKDDGVAEAVLISIWAEHERTGLWRNLNPKPKRRSSTLSPT